MAAKNYVWIGGTGGSPNAWATAANWDLNDGTVPGTNNIADTATFDANATDGCVVDANRQLGALTLTSGFSVDALDFNSKELDVSGNVSINTATTADTGGTGSLDCSGNYTITNTVLAPTIVLLLDGTGTLSADANSLATNLTINTVGTITFASDSYCGNFTLTAGIINSAGYSLYTSGNIVGTAATITELNIITSGDNFIQWNISAAPITFLNVASGTLTRDTANTYVSKLLVSAPATLNGVRQISIQNPTSSAYLDIQGTMNGTGNLTITLLTSVNNSGRVVVGADVLVSVISALGVNRSTEWTGVVNVPDLWVYSNSSGAFTTDLHLKGQLPTLGVVNLGYPSGTHTGNIHFYSTAKVGTLRRKAASTATDCTVNLHSCFLELSTVFNGTGLVVNADDKACHIVGVGAPDILGVTIAGGYTVHTHECTDNIGTVAANTGPLTFNTEAYPGSLALCGVGY